LVGEDHLDALGAVGVIDEEELERFAKLRDAGIGEGGLGTFAALNAVEVCGQREASPAHFVEGLI
jgi:hypothetical protein